MEDLTEEGIKAALRELTENTRRIRRELLDQMRRPVGSPQDDNEGHESRHYEIRGGEGLGPKAR